MKNIINSIKENISENEVNVKISDFNTHMLDRNITFSSDNLKAYNRDNILINEGGSETVNKDNSN